MAFLLTFEPIPIVYSAQQKQTWKDGGRADCIDEYCRNLPGTLGFGEYLAGKFWQERGYRWIHHDYNVFGGNKPGKYPESEAILQAALGVDELAKLRTLHEALWPLRETHHVPFEEPDLLIYRRTRGATEIRFAECKRMDSRDKINRRQALGLYLLGAVLRCPVDVFVIAEEGKVLSLEPISFRYPEV